MGLKTAFGERPLEILWKPEVVRGKDIQTPSAWRHFLMICRWRGRSATFSDVGDAIAVVRRRAVVGPPIAPAREREQREFEFEA